MFPVLNCITFETFTFCISDCVLTTDIYAYLLGKEKVGCWGGGGGFLLNGALICQAYA
jgi:hypothetical protein